MDEEESAEVIVPYAVVREGLKSLVRKESIVVRSSYIAEIRTKSVEPCRRVLGGTQESTHGAMACHGL